jgi:hypothetical protein
MSSNSQLITYNIPIAPIDINVLRADISVYLGPLATVKAVIDDNNGRPMHVYQITALRRLTPIEREDLEKDSEKWQEEFIKLLKAKSGGSMLQCYSSTFAPGGPSEELVANYCNRI